MFIVDGVNMCVDSGALDTHNDCWKSKTAGKKDDWLKIGKNVFYTEDGAKEQVEKNRLEAIAYHEKALEELRRKNP
jgi:hypothetical protein